MRQTKCQRHTDRPHQQGKQRVHPGINLGGNPKRGQRQPGQKGHTGDEHHPADNGSPWKGFVLRNHAGQHTVCPVGDAIPRKPGDQNGRNVPLFAKPMREDHWYNLAHLGSTIVLSRTNGMRYGESPSHPARCVRPLPTPYISLVEALLQIDPLPS
uniref:hypothetical protein n=1 Tax=Nitrospira cf. moscoviensis SBR1015 TaxID=96242 RepID=UPI00117C0F76|nr:hypothetical protein [Nitrospira cf. moscoviensis SBR1015]